MRKSVYLIMMAALPGAWACQNFQEQELRREEIPAVEQQAPQFTIKAVMEDPSGTKTSLDENAVLWTAGDQIKVFNASNPAGVVYTLSSGAGTAQADFSGGEVSGDGPFYAVYPASVAGTLAGSTVSVDIPQIQTLSAGSFGNGANVSIAQTDALDASFQFKNALGAVTFTLNGSPSIKSVRVQTKGTEALWGGGTLTLTEGVPALTLSATDTDHQAVYLNGSAQTGVLCLMLPPGALADGFMAEFVNSEDMAMVKSAKGGAANTVQRNHFRAMPAFDFTGELKAAFLEPETPTFGSYDNVGAENALAAFTFNKVTCQYATRSAAETRTLRLQSLPQGKYFEATVPNTLALGASSDAVEISTVSAGAYANGTFTYSLVKTTSQGAWFVSADKQKGFIFLRED